MFESLLNKLTALDALVEKTRKEDISIMSKFLYDRVAHPDSYLVFLGETSSGKSSIINGLLGKDILPMRATPSTAAITEVELVEDDKEAYLAINKNATMERLDKDTFRQLSEKPDANLKRLKYSAPIDKYPLKNLRIFDTPGYGSIVEEHEEVLKEFLPNSDAVVYTVNYKIGIQEEDYIFLAGLKELLRNDVEVTLLINRCPEGVTDGSLKIQKIRQIISDILTYEPVTFLVPNFVVPEGAPRVLPHSPELWDYIRKLMVAESRQRSLYEAFDQYIGDLYQKCLSVFESRYLSSKLTLDKFEEIQQIQKESAERILSAIDIYIIPTFDKLAKAIPSKLIDTECRVGKRISEELDNQGVGHMEEMIGFTNTHLLPHGILTETKEVTQYIDIVLDDLNNKVDDYIQKEIIKFNSKISIAISTNLDAAMAGVLSNLVKNMGTNSLEGYAFALGGAGGANAGIANAASHLLKKTGDLFGHTFSRATHNGLKHFIKKIGFTSMKTVGIAIAVVAELAFMGIQMATWKSSLRKQVKKGLNKWREETEPKVIEDLYKLRDENIETIRKIAEDTANIFEGERPIDINQCRADYEYAKEIGKSLNYTI